MENSIFKNIISFHNKKIDSSIINKDQTDNLVFYLLDSIQNQIEGDVVEFGCYVGESSKYLMKTLVETESTKKLFVYDSFEGLPELSKWEENTGWRPGTLVSSEDILRSNFEQNDLPFPVIHKDWFKNVPDDKIPEKISFAFLDGDFYDSIYDSLNKIIDRVSDGGYICFHDYQRPDLPGVRAAIEDTFNQKRIEYTVIEVCEQLGVFKMNGLVDKKIEQKPKVEMKYGGVTLVTGIWDIKRDELTEGWSRKFDHYLNHLDNLLKTDSNFIVYVESKYANWVWERRSKENTIVIERELEWFKGNTEIFDKIQKIRQDEKWLNQVGWLQESTQAKLEMYNPIVMSKMFLLNDASVFDPFNSSHLVWIDGAITNTVNQGYFVNDNIIPKLEKYFNKFSFVSFPYDGRVEIHGFEYGAMCSYSKSSVDKVCRGGIFGGPKYLISEVNNLYYGLMNETLSKGFMGTEESLFTIMLYNYPELFQYYEIDYDGLLYRFFENLKHDRLEAKVVGNKLKNNVHNKNNVALYVLTYNSPNQFQKMCLSLEMYDNNFLTQPKKFLLNNSLDRGTDIAYAELCDKYGFEEIKKDNIGICGGRQFIAEHAEENNFDYHFFFEDDMFFYAGPDEFCRNGFRRKIKDFYNIMMDIAWKEDFDFLKWNFSEFFGDNTRQWAWHNVPAHVRLQYFPENPVKDNDDHNAAPHQNFKNIKSFRGVPYATGDIYYCNWPQVVSREGNKKMFLDVKWAHPFEQTWMSQMYQDTVNGKMNFGILLASPTEHDRFEFYDKEERREN